MSQLKGQDKNPRKTTKGSGDRQPSRKRIQNNDSEDGPESWEKNGGKDWEDARNVYQRTKEQTEMNNTLEGVNNRITEAEDRYMTWRTEWWKSLSQNKE